MGEFPSCLRIDYKANEKVGAHTTQKRPDCFSLLAFVVGCILIALLLGVFGLLQCCYQFRLVI